MEGKICDHCKKPMGNSLNTENGAGELEIFVHVKCAEEWHICNQMGDISDFVRKKEIEDERKADEFFELMHKSTRAGLHREIEKMYNKIKDLEEENKLLRDDAS